MSISSNSIPGKVDGDTEDEEGHHLLRGRGRQPLSQIVLILQQELIKRHHRDRSNATEGTKGQTEIKTKIQKINDDDDDINSHPNLNNQSYHWDSSANSSISRVII